MLLIQQSIVNVEECSLNDSTRDCRIENVEIKLTTEH